VTLPECVLPCFDAKVVWNCETGMFDITITNQGTFAAEILQLSPQTPGLTLSSNLFNFNLPVNGSTTVSIDVSGLPTTGGQVLSSIHGPIDPKTGVAECCFLDITLPALNVCPWRPVTCVFNDDNSNGIFDIGEDRLAGWKVYVEGPQGTVTTSVSDEEGFAVFETYEPGLHAFSLRMQEGYRLTSDSCTFELDFGEIHEFDVLYLGVTDINP
jgi:hypothetical protein